MMFFGMKKMQNLSRMIISTDAIAIGVDCGVSEMKSNFYTENNIGR